MDTHRKHKVPKSSVEIPACFGVGLSARKLRKIFRKFNSDTYNFSNNPSCTVCKQISEGTIKR